MPLGWNILLFQSDKKNLANPVNFEKIVVQDKIKAKTFAN